ncbi:MAG: T9SS type A sorting domain-containing protein [Balneolaceae bacterium]
MKTNRSLFTICFVCLVFAANVNAQTEDTSPLLVNGIDLAEKSLDSIYVTNDFTYGGDLEYWSSDNFEFSIDYENGYSDFIGVLLSPSNTNTKEYRFTNSNLQPFLAEQILSIYLFVPADTSNIDSISVFLEFDTVDGDENDNDGFSSVDYRVNQLKIGDWNRLSITVPNYLALNTFGVIVQAKQLGGIPTLHADLFTSNPLFNGYASIQDVRNLSQDSVGTSFTAFSWDTSEEREVRYYLIERSIINEYNFERLDTTRLNYFVDENVWSDTQYSYRVFPVDSLERKTRVGSIVRQLTLSFPDNITWDFETGPDNWQVDSFSNLVLVDSVSYSDRKSLLLSTRGDTTDHFFFLKREQLKSIIPNQTVFFNLRISTADLVNIESLDTYFIANSNGDKTTTSYSSEELIGGAWNKLPLRISSQISSDSLKEIGLRITKKNASKTPKVFVDLITTLPNYEGVPTISAPTNFEIMDTSYTQINLQWDPSEGTGVARYELLRVGRRPPFIKDTLLNNSIKIEGLLSGTVYNYELTAIDVHGKRTTTEVLSVTTKEFERHPRFDFETGTEGWIAEEASISRTDTNATSGYYSIKLKTLDNEARFRITRDENDSSGTTNKVRNIQPAHTLTYRFWISDEDKAKINGLRFFAMDNQSDEVEQLISVDNIESDNWFKLRFQIPERLTSLKTTGFEIIGQNEGENPDVTLYIDFISTLNDAKPLPKLSIPTNLIAEVVNPRFGYKLSWTESTGENAVHKYNIYRADSASTNFEAFELDGTTSSTAFSKMFIGSGAFQIRVTALDVNELETLPSDPIYSTVGIGTDITEEPGIPKAFALHQNYPNPFNPKTIITYAVPSASNIEIRVFDVTGRLVKELVNEFKNVGTHTVTFDASNLASGVYLYQLKANSFSTVKRMLLIK